jgi:hypothetical protein
MYETAEQFTYDRGDYHVFRVDGLQNDRQHRQIDRQYRAYRAEAARQGAGHVGYAGAPQAHVNLDKSTISTIRFAIERVARSRGGLDPVQPIVVYENGDLSHASDFRRRAGKVAEQTGNLLVATVIDDETIQIEFPNGEVWQSRDPQFSYNADRLR